MPQGNLESKQGELDGATEIERVPLSEVRERLTDLINRIQYRGERFILTRNGQDIAQIVAADAAVAA